VLQAPRAPPRSQPYRSLSPAFQGGNGNWKDKRLKGILLLHLVLGALSRVLIWTVWFIHMRTQRKPDVALQGHHWPIDVPVVALVNLTGHLGGFLSRVNSPS
jgi:hypothetical protein